jgi:hypothetical protein
VRCDPSSIFQACSNCPTFRAISGVADRLLPIQLRSTPVSLVCSDVSDRVGPDPSSASRALSNGSTFEAIGALGPELFAIQYLSDTV